MDEKYLQQLWEWTTSQDPTFKNDHTFDSWKQKLNDDENYRQEFYSYILGVDETFKNDHTLDSWSNKVKKKRFFSRLPIFGCRRTDSGRAFFIKICIYF